MDAFYRADIDPADTGAWLESLDGVGHVRGLGMMAAVEVVADKATKQQFPAEIGMAQKLTDALLDRGLYTRVAMDCICIAPPLVTTDAQIDRLVGISIALGESDNTFERPAGLAESLAESEVP